MGPVLECFDKERVCDSQDHVWSREGEREKKKREEAERGPGEVVCESRKDMYSRSLRSCRELLELAVVNGEVGAEVTAELQGL